MEPNPVGVHLEVAPRTADPDDRPIGYPAHVAASAAPSSHVAASAAPYHYPPDGSAVGSAWAWPSAARDALVFSWAGVSASGISLTVSMVFCGPRMRRTFK